MQFLYPAFLLGLVTLAIPIIIHLFNFRRFKTVYFSNVSFLKELKEETSSRSRLKHLAVLACRLLALTFLVLAFAQPFIPKQNTNLSTGKKYISVYVDNSFSMGATSGGIRLLDKAKRAAKEIVQNYAPNDNFHLITNDLLGKHQRLISKEEFLSLLEEVEISPSSRSLEEITHRQADILGTENAKNKVAYLFSDYQRNMGEYQPDSTIRYNLLPLAAEQPQNIFIDSAWLAEPVQLINQTAKLLIKLRNTGEKSIDGGRLSLKINGETKGIADYSIAAASTTIDTISYTINRSGWNRGELSLQDYPITYDDSYYFAYQVASKIKVLSIYESRPSVYIDGVYRAQAEIDYTTANVASLDYSLLKSNQMIVLAGLQSISSGLAAAIEAVLADGGSVAIFMPEKCDLESYNKLIKTAGGAAINPIVESAQELQKINLQQNVFKDVFDRVPENLNLPKVKKYYPLSTTATSGDEPILTLKNGAPLVTKYDFKAGTLYLCTSPLDKAVNELPVHALFAPMLYRMAITGSHSEQLAYEIGDKAGIEIQSKGRSDGKIYKVRGNDLEFIPQQLAVGNKMILGLKDQIKKSGFYAVSLENKDSGDVIAMNYDRKESVLDFYSIADLKRLYAASNINVVNSVGVEVAQIIKEMDRGVALWRLFLILCLIALGAEIALLRFWKG